MNFIKNILSITCALAIFACSKENPPDLRAPLIKESAQNQPNTTPTAGGTTDQGTADDLDKSKNKKELEDITKSLSPELAQYVSAINAILLQNGKPALRVTKASNLAAETNGSANLSKFTTPPVTVLSINDNGVISKLILTSLVADQLSTNDLIVTEIIDSESNIIGIAQIQNGTNKLADKLIAISLAKEVSESDSDEEASENTEPKQKQ